MNAQASVSLDHILALLARLDLRIRREVVEFRMRQPQQDDEFRGLYISNEEVDGLLAESAPSAGALVGAQAQPDFVTALDAALRAAGERVAQIEAQARQAGAVLRLEQLCRMFELSDLEREVLVLCLAAEISLKYERLYAYLQDDVTKKRPTVDLVMRLLCRSVGERVAARSSFEPDAPLIRWELVTLHDDPNARRPVLIARYLKLDERIARYLFGYDEPDARLAPILREPAPVDGALSEPTRVLLSGWGAHWREVWAAGPPVVMLHGRYGTGRREAAALLASALGRPLVTLSALDLVAKNLNREVTFRLAERDALLVDGLLCWED